MRISVITPVFNGVEYMRTCVENVASQKVRELEHIVVDGGSTDGTLALLDQLAREYSHLRILGGPDNGQSDAMNKGVRAARGRVLGFLNADDFYEEQTINRALSHIEQMDMPSLVAGTCRVLDEYGATVSWNKPKALSLKDFLLGWTVKQFPVNPSAYFYHASIHDIVGLYDQNDHYSMDVDFLVRCAEKANIVYVDEHWGNFRLRPGCKTFDDLENTRARLAEIIARYETHLSFAGRLEVRLRRLAGKDFKAGLRRRLAVVGL